MSPVSALGVHRYIPQVSLEQDKMYIDHGRLYCSAGVNAGMDLSLYLVEKFCGRKAAVESAKTMVSDMGRERQTPYDCYFVSKDHEDSLIVEAQEWEPRPSMKLPIRSGMKTFHFSGKYSSG